ncbi:MAG: hypothetical protein COA82_03665 [Alkaliphilus sp.]|nr:MAG: hypothetical protein COA82_03665 [Alkaliphilus sp.]
MSEGQKGSGDMGGTVELNNIEFKYPVIGRLRKPDYVVSTPYSPTSRPGMGNGLFEVTFKTNWLKVQHTVESPRGTQARIEFRPVRDGLHWKYTLRFMSSDPQAYVPAEDLRNGTKWAMIGGANVAQSLSMGNESNVVAPGMVKGQASILRKSYRLAGNITNKTVECLLPNSSGGTTSLWMPWEQWQHLISWKEAMEEHCWYAKYNRLSSGEILLKDPDSGLPIPIMAGILDQIPNEDTYSVLTEKKIKSTIRDVMYGATDTGAMDVVLYCGLGFQEEFDNAMKDSAAGFTQIIGDKFVRGSSNSLIFGGYFKQYEHIDGHVITLKHLPLLDQGGRAMNSEKHPITGLPISSYDAYFIDQSVYDGKRNLVMGYEKGRSMITGVLKGMAATPMNFAGNNINVSLATEQDQSSVHFMATKSIIMRRNTHSFKLTCNLS